MGRDYSIDKSQPRRIVVRQSDGRRFELVATINHSLRDWLNGTAELEGWAVLTTSARALHDIVSPDQQVQGIYRDSKGLLYRLPQL